MSRAGAEPLLGGLPMPVFVLLAGPSGKPRNLCGHALHEMEIECVMRKPIPVSR
jgi:hypothetical protein